MILIPFFFHYQNETFHYFPRLILIKEIMKFNFWSNPMKTALLEEWRADPT